MCGGIAVSIKPYTSHTPGGCERLELGSSRLEDGSHCILG